jgi:hypothetical protein
MEGGLHAFAKQGARRVFERSECWMSIKIWESRTAHIAIFNLTYFYI